MNNKTRLIRFGDLKMASGSKNRSKSVSIRRSGQASSDKTATAEPSAPVETSATVEHEVQAVSTSSAPRKQYDYLRAKQKQTSPDPELSPVVDTTPIKQERRPASAAKAPKTKQHPKQVIAPAIDPAQLPSKRPFLRRSLFGIPVKLLIVLTVIPASVAGLIWHLNNKKLIDISEPSTFTLSYLDPAYSSEQDKDLLTVIGGTLNPDWGIYKQPIVPWYEKQFCRGRQKAWFCPEVERHPYIESYKYYNVKVPKSNPKREAVTTLKR